MSSVIVEEIIKKVHNKLYYAVTKIQNDRKRPEIYTIHKEFIKTPNFKDITKDCLQDRVDKLVQNETLLKKLNRDKDSLYINRGKINYPRISIHRFPHTLRLQHDPRHLDKLRKQELKGCKFLCRKQNHNST